MNIASSYVVILAFIATLTYMGYRPRVTCTEVEPGIYTFNITAWR